MLKMEEVQTDTLSDYEKKQSQDVEDHEPMEPNKDNESVCTALPATLLNGAEDIEDPLDLMDNCENASIGSDSDVWKGSDSEEEAFDQSKVISEISATNKETVIDDKQMETEECQLDKVDTNATKENLPETEESLKNNDSEITEIIEAEETEKNKPSEEKDESGDIGGSTTDKTISSKDNTEENISSNGNDSSAKEDAKEAEKEQPEQETPKESEAKTAEVTENEQENKNAPEQETEDQDPVVEVLESDPLAVTTAEKDPLAIATTEKDPLAPDDTFEKNMIPHNRNDDVDEDVQMEYDAADDDDFDPSLLCPEVSMAVDEHPVITNNGPLPNEGDGSSPLPYDPAFSTFVDEITGAEISFNLSGEEQELRKRLYGPTNPIQNTRVHCTACNVHLGSALETQNNRFVHPLLKVLICKRCYQFYTSGDFDKDEDGSELYCRWCGQGGQVVCCSKCEYVFCKRCIRTNFGRKKMFEIRDNDNWDCFRCNPSQIITQRIACYEFFEYVRREIPRAATLKSPEIWAKDYSRCCSNKKRASENNDQEMKKPKKRKGDTDPDYDPFKNIPIVVPTPSVTQTPPVVTTNTVRFGGNKGIPRPKAMIQIVPRTNMHKKDNDIEFVRHIPAPQVALNPIGPTTSTMTTFRTVLPSSIRQVSVRQPAPNLVRLGSQPPLPPLVPSGRILGNALQGRPINNSNMMKHEWFEKTVRAAARVNSHLSYTLTQLNKAQSQAASVEELAVVHNKLQEILSSSINSLIQIRKNLRSEFIAGIKTVRLPSKKADTFNNDDDVIFVSAPTSMPQPSTSFSLNTPKDPIVIIDKSTNKPTSLSSVTVKSTAVNPPKGYLKVKSMTELQNVPSECITIPDDAPTIKRVETKSPTVEVICNGTTEQVKVPVPDLKETKDSDTTKTATPTTTKPEASNLKNIEPEKAETTNTKKSKEAISASPRELRTRKSKSEQLSKLMYNMKDEATSEIKRMMSVTVNLERSDLKDLQKRLPNGCH